MTAEELNAVSEDVVQQRDTLVGYSFRAFGSADVFIVVRHMAMRKAAERNSEFITIVLDLDVTKVGVCSGESNHYAMGAAESHWSVRKPSLQLRDQMLGDRGHDG